jgi:hypothetical protein
LHAVEAKGTQSLMARSDMGMMIARKNVARAWEHCLLLQNYDEV